MAHFYAEKINEIKAEVEVLVDVVGASGIEMKKSSQRRKISSVVSVAVQRFESIMHGTKVGTLSENSPSNSPVPDMEVQLSESLDDEYLGHLDSKKKDEFLKSADSIKRAITDIYRTAKLLHNFSIMNYTGFVKIGKTLL